MGDYFDDKVYVYDTDGNYQSDRDFDLAFDNSSPSGIAWDGAYLYVVDTVDGDPVYVYDADGNYQSDRNFDLATGNVAPFGIAWDGAYFYVGDYDDDKVYVYDADGNYQSDRDFDLAAGNTGPLVSPGMEHTSTWWTTATIRCTSTMPMGRTWDRLPPISDRPVEKAAEVSR